MPESTPESVTVYRLGKDRPVQFAASELRRYLSRMTGRPVRTRVAASYRADTAGVWVGTAEAFGSAVPADFAKREHPFDDAVFVRARAGKVVVAGVNARSVVFAAYRYLEELGCRWLRPGKQGERVPHRPRALARRIAISEAPTSRHRCICTEGSFSEEHLRSIVDWAAKRGFNAYFMQFRNSYHFLRRWYCEEEGAGKKPVPFTNDDAFAVCDRIKTQLRKRGMIVHRVGHGWTCDPFGVEGNEWKEFRGQPPASIKRFLALRGGKRTFYRRIPVNTQLCYSDPEARGILTRSVAAYAGEHPDEEVIHVWLGDDSNNFCECARCSKTRPSDQYVEMLNEIDELLPRRNLATRIVFLAYVDLLWAPRKERLRNPERFILMFAPITRSYATSILGDRTSVGRTPPYVRNRLKFPSSPRGSLKLLDGWRQQFEGDCVDFDYHLWRAHRHDPGQMALAAVLFKDIVELDELGMNGFISCQVHRICFPTGLWMHAMGKALWDRQTDYGEMVDEYFADLFGRDGLAVKEYLSRLSALFDPPLLRGEKPDPSREKWLRDLARVPALVEEFLPTVERGVRSADRVSAAAWRLLREHTWYAGSLAALYGAAHQQPPAVAAELYEQHVAQLARRHPRLHHVLDIPAAAEAARELLASWRIAV